ncbi:unnamed protein product [Onchocerca flexuosa]|uniref:Albumin I chain a n=1 Tax=Onchocerca flexuosa TaxID=387005 RepID=A0A183H7I5_9BILA|nr:unnamed protein product [Onchocerca flexuosa]
MSNAKAFVFPRFAKACVHYLKCCKPYDEGEMCMEWNDFFPFPIIKDSFCTCNSDAAPNNILPQTSVFVPKNLGEDCLP